MKMKIQAQGWRSYCIWTTKYLTTPSLPVSTTTTKLVFIKHMSTNNRWSIQSNCIYFREGNVFIFCLPFNFTLCWITEAILHNKCWDICLRIILFWFSFDVMWKLSTILENSKQFFLNLYVILNFKYL